MYIKELCFFSFFPFSKGLGKRFIFPSWIISILILTALVLHPIVHNLHLYYLIHQENSRSTCLTLRHLEESASVTQGPLVASVINLRQVQKQLASLYLLHLHELFKVFRAFKVVKVFKAAGVFKVVKFV